MGCFIWQLQLTGHYFNPTCLVSYHMLVSQSHIVVHKKGKSISTTTTSEEFKLFAESHICCNDYLMYLFLHRFEYNLFMPEYTGGVSAITVSQYGAVNGFSNMYMGWGCEDEDFYVRVVNAGLGLVRVGQEQAITKYSVFVGFQTEMFSGSPAQMFWGTVILISKSLKILNF